MPLSFGNSAEVVGQVGNLRRVGNPPAPLYTGQQAPVANRRAGYHPAPQFMQVVLPPYWMATVTGALAAPAAVTTTGTLGPAATPGGTSTLT